MMRKCESLFFEEPKDFMSLPAFKLHTVDCPQCHLRHPVPDEYIDWRATAETYQKAYESMTTGFFDLLKEAGEQFDVPLVEYFEADRESLISQIKELMERFKPDRNE